jgi:glycosyltransferase involved in cell wall biosynthesis
VVEALGAGLAAVVSGSAGSTDDLAVDGVNSLVVYSTDPEPWAAAIERLVQDSELRARLGAAARRTISHRWTIEHSADAFVAGLRLGALLSRQAPGRRRTRA